MFYPIYGLTQIGNILRYSLFDVPIIQKNLPVVPERQSNDSVHHVVGTAYTAIYQHRSHRFVVQVHLNDVTVIINTFNIHAGLCQLVPQGKEQIGLGQAYILIP